MWHEILIVTGVLIGAGGSMWYNFWSGFGSDFGEVIEVASTLSAAIMIYKKLNCHVAGCRKIGLHHVEGTPYVVCKKHHPGIPHGDITHAHLKAAWLARKPNKTTPLPQNLTKDGKDVG